MKIRLAVVSFLTGAAISTSAVAIPITSFVVPYEQNFDTLALSGTSTTLPDGWALAESGSNGNDTYGASTGSSTTGNTYSFGAAGSTERALGGLQSGSLVPTFGVQFENLTGDIISSLEISFAGEQWRLGAVGREDRLDFQYRLDATELTGGNWVDYDDLDFVAPITTGSTGARDGNASDNRSMLNETIDTLSIGPGATFWLRWSDFSAAGADDGLALDDFSLLPIMASSGPPPQNAPEVLPFGFVGAMFFGLLAWSWSNGRRTRQNA